MGEIKDVTHQAAATGVGERVTLGGGRVAGQSLGGGMERKKGRRAGKRWGGTSAGAASGRVIHPSVVWGC